MTGKNASLVGREGELSRLRELVAPPYEESRALLLLGDPGVGKTARVIAAVDQSEYRGFAARTRHAAGLAALLQGSYLTAYAQLSPLFAPDGPPLHHPFTTLPR